MTIHAFRSIQGLSFCIVTMLTDFGEVYRVFESKSYGHAKEFCTNELSYKYAKQRYGDDIEIKWSDNPLKDQDVIAAMSFYEANNDLPFVGRL